MVKGGVALAKSKRYTNAMENGVNGEEGRQQQEQGAKQRWVVAGSRESHSTINPINQFMEVHFVEAIEKCTKELFRLGAGEKKTAACVQWSHTGTHTHTHRHGWLMCG